jgi:zinc/manganese transport system permease protein
MLVGRLLFVEWPEIGKTALIYAAIAMLHVLLRRPFFAISAGAVKSPDSPVRIKLWDFVFYASFGVVVTSSVQMAGVLLVFSFLIVPAACSMLFFTTVRARLLAGWTFGLVASSAGLASSARWDLPTGATVVAAFGAVFACCALAGWILVLLRRLRDGL